MVKKYVDFIGENAHISVFDTTDIKDVFQDVIDEFGIIKYDNLFDNEKVGNICYEYHERNEYYNYDNISILYLIEPDDYQHPLTSIYEKFSQIKIYLIGNIFPRIRSMGLNFRWILEDSIDICELIIRFGDSEEFNHSSYSNWSK